ncbi:MAG: SDR family NAD(P)-dependent oxidoreductase [Candidatus Humimicrobiaceae bacterium]
MLLKDKVIIITGGTKGLGRALSLKCASLGAKVIVAGRNEKDGNYIINEIKNKYKIQALFIKVDLSDVGDCKKLISETVNYFGRIDGLVNYAGILPASSIIDTEENLFDEVFNINVKGSFFCTKFAIISMLKTGGGSIVNIGSLHAYGGDEDRAAYSCSKGALLTLTKYVAKNYAKYNIRANWVTMGWVATPGELTLRKSEGRDLNWLQKTAKEVMPMGRLQTEEDHIPSIVHLLSDESSQVTGSEIHITGGLILK